MRVHAHAHLLHSMQLQKEAISQHLQQKNKEFGDVNDKLEFVRAIGAKATEVTQKMEAQVATATEMKERVAQQYYEYDTRLKALLSSYEALTGESAISRSK
jgi:hypothetical protein